MQRSKLFMNENHSEPYEHPQSGDKQFVKRYTFVTDPVLHTLSEYRSLKDTRKNFCYMLKAKSPCFYQRKYTCQRCKPCRSFKTDPFTDNVKCEREKVCGKWKKQRFVRK